MDKIESMIDHVPTMYGSVVLYFPNTIAIELLQSDLHEYDGICVCENCIEVTCKEVQNFCTWELDELLTALFERCDFEEISNVIDKYQGSVLIDIAFYHTENYPALVFSGKNMEIIHSLRADIAIDPY